MPWAAETYRAVVSRRNAGAGASTRRTAFAVGTGPKDCTSIPSCASAPASAAMRLVMSARSAKLRRTTTSAIATDIPASDRAYARNGLARPTVNTVT